MFINKVIIKYLKTILFDTISFSLLPYIDLITKLLEFNWILKLALVNNLLDQKLTLVKVIIYLQVLVMILAHSCTHTTVMLHRIKEGE